MEEVKIVVNSVAPGHENLIIDVLKGDLDGLASALGLLACLTVIGAVKEDGLKLTEATAKITKGVASGLSKAHSTLKELENARH